MDKLKQTPLYNIHVELGAKMAPFAGWEVPIRYTSVIEEHNAVRNRCGLFDVSHMGELEIRGSNALEAIQLLTTNDASRLASGQIQYTLLCNHDGGVIDDVTVYKFNEKRYMLCVNASNTGKVYNWIKEQVGPTAEVSDISKLTGQIAIQGPLSLEVLQPITDTNLSSLRYYRFHEGSIGGTESIISRMGYTGEDGFEIFTQADKIEQVWQALMNSGKKFGILASGLASRDTLRLEMGYPLYGHELNEKTTPLEAGLDRFVKLDKPTFTGKIALEKKKKKGIKKRLVGLEMLEPGIPRQGYHIIKNDIVIGNITSGTFSPTLKKPIAMGYIKAPFSSLDTELYIMIRKKPVKGRVVAIPFYKKTATNSCKPTYIKNNLLKRVSS
jgi:aminomethyltransferase